MTCGDPGEITILLRRMEKGDRTASDILFQRVYPDLRRMARFHMNKWGPGQTLQPTALVHEAFLKMMGGKKHTLRDRGHFMSLASKAMRCILVDAARAKSRRKRGGGRKRVSLDDALQAFDKNAGGLVALDRALAELESSQPRLVRVVEMRFFGGIGLQEIAETLGVSVRTVDRDWKFAKAWLHKALS